MSVYKPFTRKNFSVTPIEINQKVTLYSSSLGVSHQSFTSGSLKANGITPTTSGSYWQSLRMNFYLSGSDLAMRNNSGLYPEVNKYNNRFTSLAQFETVKDYYLSKFNDTGVVISIPHIYWGTQIQRGSFELIDTSTSTTIKLKDDGYGNLYATDASIIPDSTTSVSSSTNYIGNIFYNTGIVVITDTGSHSTNNNYGSVGRNYHMNFKSTEIIFQKDYTITINTNDFNISNNPSSRQTGSDGMSSEEPLNSLTGSNWTPYMSTIGFYNKNKDLVMVARYPQPIKLQKDMNLTFKIRQDW